MPSLIHRIQSICPPFSRLPKCILSILFITMPALGLFTLFPSFHTRAAAGPEPAFRSADYSGDWIAAVPEDITAADSKDDSHFHSDAPSALLMEASTGQVIYEQDADTKRAPASVTKVMTLLLIFDALHNGALQRDDMVTVSQHAASMGGSQVYLEPDEKQTVDTMIKCIAVSSANDACVAMAEHISGSEEAFVKQMNQRAAGLGMKNTHFINCCGLDAEGHFTTARDIALMSRELTIRYPEVFHYTGIWMDNIIHVTKRGSSEFGLSNTNKLIRQYQGATGLKTGSTSKAGFCLSGTATRNDISLIAVVMACDSSKARVAACSALLDYGFANCHVYEETPMPGLPDLPLKQGLKDQAALKYSREFRCVTTNQMDPSKIRHEISLPETVKAPIREGQTLGTAAWYYGDKLLGNVEIVAAESIEKADYGDWVRKMLEAVVR